MQLIHFTFHYLNIVLVNEKIKYLNVNVTVEGDTVSKANKIEQANYAYIYCWIILISFYYISTSPYADKIIITFVSISMYHYLLIFFITITTYNSNYSYSMIKISLKKKRRDHEKITYESLDNESRT